MDDENKMHEIIIIMNEAIWLATTGGAEKPDEIIADVIRKLRELKD